jgi:Uma2 family endonuclease
MGMAAPIYYTADQVRALPEDGNRYEVVHGEILVTPAPRLLHQEVVGRLLIALSRYLEVEPAGHVLLAPADISWGPDTLVQPDVFVVPVEQARSLDWSRIQDLLLVAEVLSPSSARADRFTKRIASGGGMGTGRHGSPLRAGAGALAPDRHDAAFRAGSGGAVQADLASG